MVEQTRRQRGGQAYLGLWIATSTLAQLDATAVRQGLTRSAYARQLLNTCLGVEPAAASDNVEQRPLRRTPKATTVEQRPTLADVPAATPAVARAVADDPWAGVQARRPEDQSPTHDSELWPA